MHCRKCKIEFVHSQRSQRYCPTCRVAETPLRRYRGDYKRRLKMIHTSIKTRCVSKGLPCNLTHEHLVMLWEENNGACCITNIPFELDEPYIGKGRVNPNMVSVDKIIPEQGYVIGNVRLVNYHLNCAMLDYGVEGFEKLIKAYQTANNILGVK